MHTKAARRRPNVVVLLSDDQGPWAMGCAGNPEIRTPNLDRLAATGLRFENFFCASPVCSPARATLLTGRLPSQHGVHDWIRRGNLDAGGDRGIEYLAGLTGYTQVLADAGYTCGLSGKWHLGDSLRPQQGFSHWFAHQTGGSSYHNAPMIRDGRCYAEPRYLTEAITDDALEFLHQHGRQEAPFYLSVHYTAPHSPWVGEHPEEIVASYADCPFHSCPDVPAHPWQIASAPRGSGTQRREILQGYFAAVTAMDAQIGRILDLLEAEGLRENTLVCFLSDNGMNMGHHGVFGKGNGTFPLNLYDTSVKVPALFSLPGTCPQGRVEEGLYSHYDFLPTLLDFLDLPIPEPESLPGHSFAPLLRGAGLPGHQNVVVFDEYGPVRMIRDRRWKYVHRYPYGPHELYDLEEDPGEEHNLVGETGAAQAIAPLKAELDRFFVRYADPARDGTREAVYGVGQIGLAGPAGKGSPAFHQEVCHVDENGRPRGAGYWPLGPIDPR